MHNLLYIKNKKLKNYMLYTNFVWYDSYFFLNFDEVLLLFITLFLFK